MKMLGATEVFGKPAPQLGDITDTVRDELLTAGKAAATAAVSNRVDSLTSSIHERAERLRNPGDAVAARAGEATEAAGTAGRTASSGARRATSAAGGAARRATGRGRPGARDLWGLEGAEAVLTLRAVITNGDFGEYWRFHLASEHQWLYPGTAQGKYTLRA